MLPTFRRRCDAAHRLVPLADGRHDPAIDAADLRRRRANALRLPPLPDGRRDPLDPMPRPPVPSSFGLSVAELLAEGRRCRAAGWATWELHARLTSPATLKAAT